MPITSVEAFTLQRRREVLAKRSDELVLASRAYSELFRTTAGDPQLAVLKAAVEVADTNYKIALNLLDRTRNLIRLRDAQEAAAKEKAERIQNKP